MMPLEEKNPTRVILEQGGVVDGEAFELMLKDESHKEIADQLKQINNNLQWIKDFFEYGG